MSAWFETSLGQFLLKQERIHCNELVPSGYYPRSLQVGQPSINFLKGIATDQRFFIGDCALRDVAEDEVHCAVAQASTMPFGDKIHNLIILPHTLDFCATPHSVLREVNQILMPQGCVVIIGFNPWSLWGGLCWLLKSSGQLPRVGQYRRVGRIQDWLSLLGFELVGANMFAYRPPLQNKKWREKLAFFEKAGARWWPGLGAVYVLVGRKQENALIRPTLKRPWQRLLPQVGRSAARVDIKPVSEERASK